MAEPLGRPLRADARRNRARVLRVAAEVFAAEGLSVPLHEIAHRAGVGTGTVSRHFPTKEDLFAAVLLDRMREILDRIDALPAARDPGAVFFALFDALVREGAAHCGLSEALTGAGYDLDKAAADAGYDVQGRLRDLLRRAQEAGAVRAGLTYPDVKALMAGCLARGTDPDGLDRVVAVVRDGMRPQA